MNEKQFDVHWGKFQSIFFVVLCLIIPGYTYFNIINTRSVPNNISLALLFVDSVIYSIPLLVLGIIFFSYKWGNMRIFWKNSEDDRFNYTMLGFSGLAGLLFFYFSIIIKVVISDFIHFEYTPLYYYFLVLITSIMAMLSLLIWRLIRGRDIYGGIKK